MRRGLVPFAGGRSYGRAGPGPSRSSEGRPRERGEGGGECRRRGKRSAFPTPPWTTLRVDHIPHRPGGGCFAGKEAAPRGGAKVGIRKFRRTARLPGELQRERQIAAKGRATLKRIGLIPPSTAREIVRLPRGNQAKAAEAVCRHGLSARETHGLVRLLLSARPDERRGILDDPRQELPPTKPPSAPPPDPALGQTANRIRGQILSIHSRANRLEALLMGVSGTSLTREEAELIAKLAALVLEKVKTVLLTAKKLGEKEASHAG